MGLFLISALLSGFLSLCQLSLLKERAQSAARLGAMLQSTGALDQDVIEAALADYTAGFRSSPPAQWEWRNGRFTDTPASRFYHLVMTEVRGAFHPGWSPVPFSISEKVVVQKEPNL